jgi:diazepam-binding inhibitor (GABA receptor modulating acyl-CoA-binding protein)
MDLTNTFLQAVSDSKMLPSKPDNMTLLKLYALYKQANSGDADGPEPGAFDIIAKAKFDAWKGLAGTSKEEAMQKYIDLVNELKQ